VAHEFTGVVVIPSLTGGPTRFVTGDQAATAIAAGTGTRQRRRHRRSGGGKVSVAEHQRAVLEIESPTRRSTPRPTHTPTRMTRMEHARSRATATTSVAFITGPEPTSPGERRGFIHKRIIGGAVGFLGGGFAGAAKGFLQPGGSTQQAQPRFITQPQQQPCLVGFEPDGRGGCMRKTARSSSFGGVPLPQRPGAPRASAAAFAERPDFFGDAVMGQYGVALEPGVMVIERTVCPDGMLVATDGLCYNRSQLRNKERRWPKGRRPLLTGGDLNAISKAKRAATRLHNATSSVRAIGLLKPAPKRRKKA